MRVPQAYSNEARRMGTRMQVPAHVQVFASVIAILAYAPRSVPAQAADTTATIAGEIVDAVSGRPVSQAEVSLRGSALRVSTDLKGSFVLRRIAPGRHSLEVRRIGFESLLEENIVVTAGGTASLRLSMQPAAFRLADVTVVPGSFSFLEAGPVSRQTRSRAQIEEAPFGEDLFRALTRSPGLASGDYGAGFAIRGGRHDETLFLLDGLELYEPFHLKDFDGGALSVIDVEAIDGVELLTGGFPAHYGDRRSGVMNISSRTPREDGTHLSIGASFTNVHALAEGTFADRRGSWLLSGRNGFVDLALRLINKKETQAPRYHDVFGRMTWKLHPRHTLAFNVLHAADQYRFGIDGPSSASSRTTASSHRTG